MSNEREILDGIDNLYRKIDQATESKKDLERAIQEQMDQIDLLQWDIAKDEEREAAGKKTRFDLAAMREEVNRCHNNIVLFRETIAKEDTTIGRFREMISVLRQDLEDLKKPKTMIVDMEHGGKVTWR